ncbi:two-component system sensor histidine kinase NtrB [Archangium gephyra]|uniref:two-component system sensor histidine kinase NtrB n=1 Tax=Archangium gephyra TaxID=48 RepID=UPI003B775C7E
MLGLPPYPSIIASLLYLGSLVLVRRSTTPGPATMLMLTTMVLVILGTAMQYRLPYFGMHALAMLIPALAVFLAGARVGLFVTLLLIATLSLGYPLYLSRVGIDPASLSPAYLNFSYFFAGVAFLGAWGLGSLHNTTRDSAQASLEQTLKALRESETRLSSVLESTDDLVVSIDMEGNLLTANSAARQFHRRCYGKEPVVGQLFGTSQPARPEVWGPALARVRAGQRARFEDEYELEGVRHLLDVHISPLFGPEGRAVGMTLFGRDITARREDEVRLSEMHRALVETSRQAGMAEVSTGVLHNVGNTLNSVNISTSVITERLRKSRVSGLAKATELLSEHTADLASFLTQDLQGQKLPAYLIAVSRQLQEEREGLLQEMHALGESVEHINSIIAMQQMHARAAGVVEQVALPQLFDEALRLIAGSFEKQGIRIERDYAPVPPISVDRHKLLQILINLLSNARHALVDSAKEDKWMRLRIRPAPDGTGALIEVTDNGVGIAPETLPRLFMQGFTTRKTGHGFGLHISALSAAEMKGRLTCSSPGLGQGATFTLELPHGGKRVSSVSTRESLR